MYSFLRNSSKVAKIWKISVKLRFSRAVKEYFQRGILPSPHLQQSNSKPDDVSNSAALATSLHRPLISRLRYLHRPPRGRTEPVRGRLDAHTAPSQADPHPSAPERLYRPRQISHVFTFSAVRRHENSCCDPRAGHYTPSLPSLVEFQKLYDRCQSSP